MSSRVKVVPVPNANNASSPAYLIQNAIDKEKELDVDSETDIIWFVVDTDRWREQLHGLRQLCRGKTHWKMAQSNPCFEVWLYFHAYSKKPELTHIDRCTNWKAHVGTTIKGGFNSDFHPIVIATAAANAKASCESDGFTPSPGSTQVWELAEQLLTVIEKDLQRLKAQFPPPEPAGE